MKIRHLEKVEHIDKDCFVSPVVIMVENDKSVQDHIRFKKVKRQLLKNQTKFRYQIPETEQRN